MEFGRDAFGSDGRFRVLCRVWGRNLCLPYLQMLSIDVAKGIIINNICIPLFKNKKCQVSFLCSWPCSIATGQPSLLPGSMWWFLKFLGGVDGVDTVSGVFILPARTYQQGFSSYQNILLFRAIFCFFPNSYPATQQDKSCTYPAYDTY